MLEPSQVLSGDGGLVDSQLGWGDEDLGSIPVSP